jgi:hypothetical protein
MVGAWLGRSENKLLGVIIDTGQKVHPSSKTLFEGLQLTLKDIRRWKELSIISFPTDEALNACHVTLYSPVKSHVRLEVLEIFPGYEQLTAIMTFLDSLTMPRLTHAHIFSSSIMIHLLGRHRYRSIFSNLADFHIDSCQLNEPIDILPLFSRLQSFTAYCQVSVSARPGHILGVRDQGSSQRSKLGETKIDWPVWHSRSSHFIHKP